MPNEDNTQVIAAIRSLEDRVINVEGIIVSRLNDTRPLEGEILARLNELNAGQSTMQEQMGSIQEQVGSIQEQVGSIQERIGSLQERFEGFRRETNDNFQLINSKLDVLNDDVLTVRAKQRGLEKRVTQLEQNPTETAA